jgi:hypothetical protein
MRPSLVIVVPAPDDIKGQIRLPSSCRADSGPRRRSSTRSSMDPPMPIRFIGFLDNLPVSGTQRLTDLAHGKAARTPARPDGATNAVPSRSCHLGLCRS